MQFLFRAPAAAYLAWHEAFSGLVPVSDIKLTAGDGRAERGDGTATPRPPRRTTPVSRHGAISRDLTKYASYKLWVEKVRGAFAADADEPPGTNGNGPGSSRR